MSFIDAHTHFLPPEIQAELPSLREHEPYWGLLLDPPTGRSIQGYASAGQMIADMDAAEVDQAVVVGEYFQKPDSCRRSNDQAIALMQQFPGRVLPLVTVQPNDRRHTLQELERGRDHGFKGVGELNPYAQGFDLASPDFAAVVEFCIEVDWPLNLHVNEEVGRYYPGKSATPLRSFFDVVGRYPEATFILAHWGGGLFFYELMAGVRAQFSNVFYDTAATPLQFPVDKIFKVALECCGAHKIMFGSDYPLRLYPRTQKQGDMGPFLAAVKELDLDQADRDAIFYGNAARCFRLAGGAESPTRSIPAPSATLIEKILPHTPVALIIENDPGAADLLRSFGFKLSDQLFSWEPFMQAAAVAGLGPSRWPALLEILNERLAKISQNNRASQ